MYLRLSEEFPVDPPHLSPGEEFPSDQYLYLKPSSSSSAQVHQEERNPPHRRVHKVIKKKWITESEYILRLSVVRAPVESRNRLRKRAITTPVHKCTIRLQAPKARFTNRPEDYSDEFRRTGGRNPNLQPSAGIEVPSSHMLVETHASGQNNVFAPRSSRGGSGYAPRERVDHRDNPLAAPVVVERQGPAQLPGLQKILVVQKQFLTELREDVDYEYDR